MANKVIKPVSVDEIRAARNQGSVFPTPKTITRNAPSSRVIERTPATSVKPTSKPVVSPAKPKSNLEPTPAKPVSAELKNDKKVVSAAAKPVAKTEPAQTLPTKPEIKKAFDDMPLVKENNPDMGTEYIEYLKAEARRNKAPANLLHGDYVNKLKSEEINNMFLPFGYIAHEQMDNQIFVICKDFDIMFSDFTLAVDDSVLSDPRKWLSDSKFNYTTFKDACDQMGLTPEQAIDEHVAIWLSERFHSYSDERRDYKEKNNRTAFKAFANSGASDRLVGLMRELKTRQDAMAEATYNRGHHGYYNPINK